MAARLKALCHPRLRVADALTACHRGYHTPPPGRQLLDGGPVGPPRPRLLGHATWQLRVLWRIGTAGRRDLPPPAASRGGGGAASLLLSPSGCGPVLVPSRCISSSPLLRTDSAKQRDPKEDERKGLARRDDDPFDAITDRIPVRPVTAVEGASYSVVILAGLGLACLAAWAVVKELVLEPKEYTVFNRALERVKGDVQITSRLGTPISGYGQESRNRAARQRISNRIWKDEDGVQRIEVQFHVRGPRGAGVVHCQMFKDSADRQLKFTYLIVDISAPVPMQVLLESYVPALP